MAYDRDNEEYFGSYEKRKEFEKHYKPLMVKLNKNENRTIPILQEEYKGNYDALFVHKDALDDEENKKYKYIGLGCYQYQGHHFLVYRKGDLVSAWESGMYWWSGGSNYGAKDYYMWEYDPESKEGKLLEEYIPLYNKRARVMWDERYYIALDHGCYDYYDRATNEHPQYHEGIKKSPWYKNAWYMDLPDYDGWLKAKQQYINNDYEYWKKVKEEERKKKWGWFYISEEELNKSDTLSDKLVGGWIIGSFLFIIIGYFLGYNLANYIWVTLVVMILYFMATSNNKDYVKKE